MEVNYSSDQFIGWPLVEDLQGRHQPRSYTCGFCKRGFSNAQALGGHMNIHRRDRAKLKQASLDSNSMGDHRADKVLEDEGNFIPKRANHSLSSIDCDGDSADDSKVMIGEDVGHEGISGVHLFLSMKVGDASSTIRIEEKNLQLRKHFSQTEMVDLELRLGPEPLETSRKSKRELF